VRCYEDVYDTDDYDDLDDGDDCHRLVGRHTEAECRYYRDEIARREAVCAALGCGREYRRLMAASCRRALPPSAHRALPLRRALPAPQDAPPDPRREDVA
jgi:hypothetical protein